jgi:hypothetical protein
MKSDERYLTLGSGSFTARHAARILVPPANNKGSVERTLFGLESGERRLIIDLEWDGEGAQLIFCTAHRPPRLGVVFGSDVCLGTRLCLFVCLFAHAYFPILLYWFLGHT